MEDDDFFSAFEELQESTAKAEAIHKALADDDGTSVTAAAGASYSATSINSTDSAESDIEIIGTSNPISTLNLVTNPDGTQTFRLPPGTTLPGLRPNASSTLDGPKISVIPNPISASHAQAAIRGGKQVVARNASGLPVSVSMLGSNGTPRSMTLPNGSSLHNQQMLRHPTSTSTTSLNRPGFVRNRLSTPMMPMGARGNAMQNNVHASTYGRSSPHQQMLNGMRHPQQTALADHQANNALNAARSSLNTAAQESAQKALAAEAQLEELEELGHHGETFAEYQPKKLKVGLKHPDIVVESASLSSVEPPEIKYQLNIPDHVIDAGLLSSLQLESITYASMQHEQILPDKARAGFLIGDGAGVGKGRTLAGIVYENWCQGRKRAIWLSVSNDLRLDALRDLRDIGAGKIKVHPLSKFKYGKLSSEDNGKVKKGVIFATYSSLIGESHTPGKYNTRLKQLLKWCGNDFDGPILFDECHKAKNLAPTGSAKPSKTGTSVLELQQKLPNARVVYSSATGATEPKNMAYMTRLGLWGKGTTFADFNAFIQAVERRGVCAMELVAMDMKLRGRYIARQLSFSGVSFRIREVPMDEMYKSNVYDQSVKLWVAARDSFQEASELLDLDQRTRKTMWGQFWSAHQRFFKYLCIAAKVPHVVAVTKEAIRDGSKCVVIGLQSTGEARTMEMLEDCGGELQEFVSTCKGVFSSLVDKHFPVPSKKTKTIDIIGEMINQSRSSSPLFNGGEKRKMTDEPQGGPSKKVKKESEESDVSSSSSDDEDDDDNDKNSSSDSENDDYNPFAGSGSGGDSDDSGDWLGIGGRSKKKAKKKKKKNDKESLKAEKKKKKLEEKAKKKAERKETKKRLKAMEKGRPMPKSTPKSTRGPAEDSDEDIDSIPVPLPSTTKTDLSDIEKVEKAYNLKQALLDRLEALGDCLPLNTLDELIDQLGGPEYVAELTGRKGRVVTNADGSVSYESRSESEASLDTLNILEKERFMNGTKLVAIISEAASSGISLQADRRAVNQRRRVHITLELPWSADRAVQQFGRTHRSNQVSAPQYIFMISDLAGERRFASTVARRLESLGALTHGDRRANESQDLSSFNIDNKFGHSAMRLTLRAITGEERPRVPLPLTVNEDSSPDTTSASAAIVNAGASFVDRARNGLTGVGLVLKDNPDRPIWRVDERTDISRFLNRLLGLEVDIQNALFDYFNKTLQSIILDSKQSGSFDMGIMDLGLGPGQSVKKIKDRSRSFHIKSPTGAYSVDLNCFGVERGMTWKRAVTTWRETDQTDDGFYVSKAPSPSGRYLAVLAIAIDSKKAEASGEKTFQMYKPSTGLLSKLELVSDLKRKYKKVLPTAAEELWETHYKMSATECTHKYWSAGCHKTAKGLNCEIGLRTRNYHVLSGSVLTVWSMVEAIINSTGIQRTMQLIRLKTEDQKRIVGCLIPNNVVKNLAAHFTRLQSGITEKSSSSSSSTSSSSSFIRGNVVGRAPTSASTSAFNHYQNSSFASPYVKQQQGQSRTASPTMRQMTTSAMSSSMSSSTLSDDDDDDDDPDSVELMSLSRKKTLDLFM